jgi:hypothetical protein
LRANEQADIMTLHIIFFREHNRIAKIIAANNPSYDSDKVFHVTRAIVSAELQKITFEDYLPLILGDTDLMPDYEGYDPNGDPRIPSAFNSAAFRFGHSQIQPDIMRLDDDYGPFPFGDLHIADTFFNTTEIRQYGTDAILRGLISDTSQGVDHYFAAPITHQLLADNSSSSGQDLVSINIQRGRDHGLPTYMTWKQWAKAQCGIESDFKSEALHAQLLEVYGSLDNVDLFVGGLAEEHVGTAIVGATFACIIAKTFTGIRDGDRFYYENSGGSLTDAQMCEIRDHATLAALICENTDINTIQENVFLTGHRRKPCDHIRKLNLDHWTEVTAGAPQHAAPQHAAEFLDEHESAASISDKLLQLETKKVLSEALLEKVLQELEADG